MGEVWSPEFVDLTGVTPPGSTTIVLGGVGWIRCGAVDIVPGPRDSRVWTVRSFVSGGATDFEHSRVFAFSLQVAALEPLWCSAGVMALAGYVVGDPDSLRVPESGLFDPAALPGAKMCDRCVGTPHVIVPEGYGLGPRASRQTWASIVGQRIEIGIGVNTEGAGQ